MHLTVHPRYAEFEAWCARHATHAQALAGQYYRVAGPRHTTAKEIISGVGAFMAGGRWNAPGVMKVVYLSRQPETALAEAMEHRRYYSLPLWQGMPKVIVAVDCAVSRVLDLTNAAVQADLPEPLANLLAEDWRALMAGGKEATAQALGRAAFEAGLQGLLAPSRPDPGRLNLVLVPEQFAPVDRLAVLNAGDLDSIGKPA